MRKTMSMIFVTLLLVCCSGCGDKKKPAEDETASASTDQVPAMGSISDTTYGAESVGSNISYASPMVHVVQKGETLWKISERYLGAGKYWQKIVDANPGIDPAKLSVGQKLNIPAQ